MMMSTPFAFDIVESSMRIMVGGDDIRVVFSKIYKAVLGGKERAFFPQ